MKKVIFSSIAALFAAICPAATTYNLANGNVTVPANTEAIITQSNSGTHKNNSIWVGANSTITLAGINGGQITCNGNVTIVLADNSNNIVTAFYQDTPGINVIRNSTLTIVGDNGTLTVKGLGNGAGIGNTGSGSCGNIVINGGVISASGKVGIGGSSCGNITINGGKITASGSQTGIGSYAYSSGSYSCGNIVITGGEVKATGNSGAGIGSDRNGGACGTIRITGGTVIARGGSGSSGIGVGASGNDYSRCGAITIANTVTKVVATKGSGATDCVGKADTHSTCGTVTFGNKLKKTYSNNNLTLTLQPVYTITWKDDNGTTLETDTEVILGTTPTYNGATPTKASTAQYSYTFKGWSPTVVAATADKTYTATYNSTLRSYHITWKDDDGTTLRVDSVPYGEMPSYGDNPTKAMTTQYTYEFSGWNTTVIPVAGAATYTATYSTTLRSYTVTWRDWDSSIIDYDVFFYGDTPEYQGEALVRDGYEFTGWFTSTTGGEPLDEAFVISGEASFFARWKQIRFLEGDVACIDGSVTLTSAQIAWLNGLGDYETIKASVAVMDAKAFEEAYLLNLDVTDAGRGYSFEVTGCDATGANVVVSVRLVRTGTVRKSGVDAPINGVLMLCGATAPAKDGFAPLSEIVMDNAKFSNGDEATLTFSKDATTRFFKPVVAMP